MNQVLPIQIPRQVHVIAHRGASAYAPENTLAAFDLALKMGVHEIELDAQLTTDGRVVLCHDHTLARYGHGEKIIEDMPWHALSSLDMGSWFSPFLYRGEPMLTLDALFERFGPALTYHVELKGRAPRLPDAVCRLINAHRLSRHCLITSFSLPSLLATQKIASGLPLGWLVQTIDADVLARAREIGLFQICPRADAVTPDHVAQATEIVPQVRAWGLSGSATEVRHLIHRVLDAGCHGMTLNWPDWVCY